MENRLFKLEDVYKENGLFYWCNASGDVNLPGDVGIVIHKSEELPPAQLDIYEHYWTEGLGVMMYVVNYNGVPGIVLAALFDKGYCEDIIDDDDEESMNQLYDAIRVEAENMLCDKVYDKCKIFVGRDTDPDGHELLVFIPYEEREMTRLIAKHMDDTVYDSIEKRCLNTPEKFDYAEQVANALRNYLYQFSPCRSILDMSDKVFSVSLDSNFRLQYVVFGTVVSDKIMCYNNGAKIYRHNGTEGPAYLYDGFISVLEKMNEKETV